MTMKSKKCVKGGQKGGGRCGSDKTGDHNAHDDDPGRCTDENMISFLPEKRYTDLFPNCKCRIYYEGFGEYFAGENKI